MTGCVAPPPLRTPSPLQREMMIAESYSLSRWLYAEAARCAALGFHPYAVRYDAIGDQIFAVGLALELGEEAWLFAPATA